MGVHSKTNFVRLGARVLPLLLVPCLILVILGMRIPTFCGDAWKSVEPLTASGGGYCFAPQVASARASFYFASLSKMPSDVDVPTHLSDLRVKDPSDLEELYYWLRLGTSIGKPIAVSSEAVRDLLSALQPSGLFCFGDTNDLGINLVTTERAVFVLRHAGMAVPDKTQAALVDLWTSGRFLNDSVPYWSTYLRILLSAMDTIAWPQSPSKEEVMNTLASRWPALQQHYIQGTVDIFTLQGCYESMSALGSRPAILPELGEKIRVLQSRDGLFNFLGPDMPVGDPSSTWTASRMLDIDLSDAICQYQLANGQYVMPAYRRPSLPDTYDAMIIAILTGHGDEFRQQASPYVQQVISARNQGTLELEPWEDVMLIRLARELDLSARFWYGPEQIDTRVVLDAKGLSDLYWQVQLLVERGISLSNLRSGVTQMIERLRCPNGGYGFGQTPDLLTTYLAVSVLDAVNALNPQAIEPYMTTVLEDIGPNSPPDQLFECYAILRMMRDARSRAVSEAALESIEDTRGSSVYDMPSYWRFVLPVARRSDRWW